MPNFLCLVPNVGNYLVYDKQDYQLIDRCLRRLVKLKSKQVNKVGKRQNWMLRHCLVNESQLTSRLDPHHLEPEHLSLTAFQSNSLHHYRQLTGPSNGNGCNPSAKALSGEPIIAAAGSGQA